MREAKGNVKYFPRSEFCAFFLRLYTSLRGASEESWKHINIPVKDACPSPSPCCTDTVTQRPIVCHLRNIRARDSLPGTRRITDVLALNTLGSHASTIISYTEFPPIYTKQLRRLSYAISISPRARTITVDYLRGPVVKSPLQRVSNLLHLLSIRAIYRLPYVPLGII